SVELLPRLCAEPVRARDARPPRVSRRPGVESVSDAEQAFEVVDDLGEEGVVLGGEVSDPATAPAVPLDDGPVRIADDLDLDRLFIHDGPAAAVVEVLV